MSHSNVKVLYLKFYKTYKCQTWHSGDLGQVLPFTSSYSSRSRGHIMLRNRQIRNILPPFPQFLLPRNFDRVVTKVDKLSCSQSKDSFITWSCEVKYQTKNLHLLLQTLWSPNFQLQRFRDDHKTLGFQNLTGRRPPVKCKVTELS